MYYAIHMLPLCMKRGRLIARRKKRSKEHDTGRVTYEPRLNNCQTHLPYAILPA